MKMLHSGTFWHYFFFSLMLLSFLFYQKKVYFVFFCALVLCKMSWLRKVNEAVEKEDSKSKSTERALISLLSFIIYFVFLWCVVISPPHSSILALHGLIVGCLAHGSANFTFTYILTIHIPIDMLRSVQRLYEEKTGYLLKMYGRYCKQDICIK